MCVLLIAWQVPGAPHLVVAANRDEARARESAPPQVEALGKRRALLPRDRMAGGTWLGVNDAGVAVAITNRAGPVVADRPSRGELPRAALSCSSATEALAQLCQRVETTPFNAFNLFCADAHRAWVARWDGTLAVTDLTPGAHVLTNSHDLDVLAVDEFADLPWRSDGPALRRRLWQLLGDHIRRGDDGTVLCKHGERYGTVSATVFAPIATGGWEMDFATGNPCTARFERLHLPGGSPDARL